MKVLIDREDLVFNPPELGCVLSLSGLPGGGSKIYDRSPYGNIGTITGATWVRLPSGLWCLSFDGDDDYVDCGSPAAFDLTGEFSLEAWVYTRDNTLAGQGVLMKDRAASDHRAYGLKFYGDDLYFSVFSEKSGTDYFSMQWADQMSNNTWHHVVGTWDGGLTTASLGMYINGVSGGTPQEIGDFVALEAVPDPLVIGYRKRPTPDQFLNGMVALPRVYNRALSAAEVQHHFSQGKHLFGVW